MRKRNIFFGLGDGIVFVILVYGVGKGVYSFVRSFFDGF